MAESAQHLLSTRVRDEAQASGMFRDNKEDVMGKYFLAWLLGVPAGLLVLIYVFTHVF